MTKEVCPKSESGKLRGKDFLELLHPQRAHYECIHG